MNTSIRRFRSYLKQRGLKITSQREYIITVFFNLKKQVTVEELHREVIKDEPSISISTLYRTVKLIYDSGLACSRQTGNGHVHYKPLQHLHFTMICEQCGTETPFADSYLDCIHAEAARQRSFMLCRSKTTIYGICSNCLKNEEEKLRHAAN